MSKNVLRTISFYKPKHLKQVLMSDDMITTLEDIIEAEKTMKARFQKLANDASTPELRALFHELAHEEAGHEKELKERLTAIRLMRDI